MVQNKMDGLFVIADRTDYAALEGNFRLWAWYSILKNYARVCKRDARGFTRVSAKQYADDWGVNRELVWRYNRELEDKGLIKIDRSRPGGRTWAGFKLI